MQSDRLASSIVGLKQLTENGTHRDRIAELVVATWQMFLPFCPKSLVPDRRGDTQAVPVSFDEGARLLIAESTRRTATRVVIDSLSGFALSLAHACVTILMTSELADRYTDLRFGPYATAFLVDSIIVQRSIEIEGRWLPVMAVVHR